MVIANSTYSQDIDCCLRTIKVPKDLNLSESETTTLEQLFDKIFDPTQKKPACIEKLIKNITFIDYVLEFVNFTRPYDSNHAKELSKTSHKIPYSDIQALEAFAQDWRKAGGDERDLDRGRTHAYRNTLKKTNEYFLQPLFWCTIGALMHYCWTRPEIFNFLKKL